MYRAIYLLTLTLTGLLLGMQAALAGLINGDWVGHYNCVIDGRPSKLIIDVVDDKQTICQNGYCTTVHSVRYDLRFSDNGGPWVNLPTRPFTSDDPPSNHTVHLLPVRHGNDPWLLVLHSGNDHISGYTTWQGTVFGFQCERLRLIEIPGRRVQIID